MTIQTRLVRLSLLSLLSAPLAGAKINAQLSQSTPSGVVLPSYEIDGYDVVPLVVNLTEDPEKPGDYLGDFWPNTRGLKGTRWLVNVAAGELLLKTLNLTVVDGSAAVELKVMVDAPPYSPVLPSSKVVGLAQEYADAAGHFASLAMSAAHDVIELGLDAGAVASAAEYARAAEAARDEAVTAVADAHLSAATKTYLTYAELLADTAQPTNTQGRVTADPTPANNQYYVWTGTGWIVSLLQPAKQADVNALGTRQTATESIVQPLDTALNVKALVHDDEGRKYALVIGDQLRMLFGVLEKGGIRMKNVLLEMAGLGSKMDGAGRTWMRELSDGVQFGCWKVQVGGTGLHLLDQDGRSAFTITQKGRAIIPGLVQSSLPSSGSAGAVQAGLGLQRRTDIMHILMYGQSLSRGFGTTAISTAQPYSNVSLLGGVLARVGDAEYDASAFRPLVEEPNSTGDAESPTSGVCNGLSRRIVQEGQSHADWRFLGSSSGQGGRPIEQLSDGGGWFEGTKQLITDAHALASSGGLSYSVWAHVLMQGEAQYAIFAGAGAKTAFEYDSAVIDLHDALTAHIVETTGQAFKPFLVTYQTGAHRHYNDDTMPIALSQWRTSREQPHVVLAIPIYAIPHNTDLLHLTSEGSWLAGEYIGRAIYWTMYRKAGKWRPLEPISVDWQPDHIDVKFHVPMGALCIDTALCTATHNSGFDIWQDGAVADLVTSVAVLSRDTVRLTLSAAASGDAVLSYGRGRPGDPQTAGPVSGARGNLRDSHGDVDTATSPLGNVVALHNPCVMFEFSRKKGF